MKKFVLLLSLLSLVSAYAQFSESEVSDMCMNQIVAGMVQDKVLGKESGICVMFKKDSDGNINGMDFKMNTSAFELGKDQLQDDVQRQRIKVIKDFVVNYQQLVTKNKKLTINDVDLQVRSYADGVTGPTTYDAEIGKMSKWSDLLNYIGEDKAGVKHLMNTVPGAKNLNSNVNFNNLSREAKSTIQNIVLAKRRSETICKEFGISDCQKRPNSGFSSPDLEKRPKEKRNCDDRRVSVISVNLDKAATIQQTKMGDFHPSFAIPSGEAGEELKLDMQMASAFEIIKQVNQSKSLLSNPEYRNKLKQQYNELIKNAANQTERVRYARFKKAIDEYDPNVLSILNLPETAQNSPQAFNYQAMVKAFGGRQTNFLRVLKNNFPDMYEAAASGDFYTFKEKAKQINSTHKIKDFKMVEALLVSRGTTTSTDLYNFFSSSEALKYHFANNPNSASLVNAATILNQSNAELKISLDQKDLKSAKNKHQDDGRAHWMCYGGCQSGIHENENGEFETKFRTEQFPNKSAKEMQAEFGSTPLGFGALKTLSVYVVNDCSNCDCLKQRDVKMEDILNSSRTKKVAINQVTKNDNGTRGFSQSVGKIADPASTCIFTPPVAHTCRVKPEGGTDENNSHAPKTNYSCAMWDKSAHGLKWTSNFVQEGLGLAETASEVACSAKATSLQDAAKSAICNFSDPKAVPDSCQ